MENIKNMQTIKIDALGMSCSQATFQAKRAILSNIELKPIIELYVTNLSTCESIERASKVFNYESKYFEKEDGHFVIMLKYAD